MDWNSLIHILTAPIESSFQGFPLLVLLLAIGMIIGILTGFFGIGGGFLVVPLLHIFAGIPYQTAVGSSLTLILGTSFTGFFKQRSSGNIQMPVACYLGMGSVAGAVFGDLLQNSIYTLTGARDELFNLSMHSIFIFLLIIILMMFKKDPAGLPIDRPPPILHRCTLPPLFRLYESDDCRISIPVTLVIGLILGILTGLLGIGGGVLLIPILIGLFGLTHKEAAGTSLAVVLITSLAAVLTKGLTDSSKISLSLTLILLFTSIIGLNFGITLLQKSGEKSFRRYFKYIILLTISLIIIDAAGIAARNLL